MELIIELHVRILRCLFSKAGSGQLISNKNKVYFRAYLGFLLKNVKEPELLDIVQKTKEKVDKGMFSVFYS